MQPTSERWKQITPSDYPWEREALDFLRNIRVLLDCDATKAAVIRGLLELAQATGADDEALFAQAHPLGE